MSVEHVRPIEGDRADPDLLALASAAELAEAEPADRLAVLCAAVARLADAEWAAVVRDGVVDVLARTAAGARRGCSRSSPAASTSRDAQRRPQRSGLGPPADDRASSVAAGRSDRTVRERERHRVSHSLGAGFADALGAAQAARCCPAA